MTTKTIYVAEDGTEFTNEDQCVKYELSEKRKQFSDSIILYDYRWYKIPFDPTGMENCFVLIVKTQEAAEYLHEEFYADCPWNCNSGNHQPKTGSWYYNERYWQEIKEFLEIAKRLEKIMKEN